MEKYIDIGLNLFCRQFQDPEKVLAGAHAADTVCILTGSDTEENRKILAFLPSHPGTYGTAGIHPHNADSLTRTDLDLIADAQTRAGVVAVGECGLDFDRMFSSKEGQIRCLEEHIEIAESMHRPMFLHERSAFDDMVRIFSRHRELCPRCVVHCFTGNRQQLSSYLEMGFMIGITGWICDDRRAGELRDAVAILPLDRVMLETDAPYLTPRNVPGLDRINRPENIRYVASELAKHMHVEEAALTEQALINTKNFFGI